MTKREHGTMPLLFDLLLPILNDSDAPTCEYVSNQLRLIFDNGALAKRDRAKGFASAADHFQQQAINDLNELCERLRPFQGSKGDG